jgi:hypothetical protein
MADRVQAFMKSMSAPQCRSTTADEKVALEVIPILEDLKKASRPLGMFMRRPRRGRCSGAGLSNLDTRCWPRGWAASLWASSLRCSAPDKATWVFMRYATQKRAKRAR